MRRITPRMLAQLHSRKGSDSAFNERGRTSVVLQFKLTLGISLWAIALIARQPGKATKMEALVYFVIWAVAIFLAMRFGCGAHIAGGRDRGQHGCTVHGRKNPSDLRWIPPATDTDPVCGKQVSTDRAKSNVSDGHVYYFCSRDCREIFEASPLQHVGPQARFPETGMEQRHV
jgi:YHS domain-containing protein